MGGREKREGKDKTRGRREELFDAKCLIRVLGVNVMDRIRNREDIRERR